MIRLAFLFPYNHHFSHLCLLVFLITWLCPLCREKLPQTGDLIYGLKVKQVTEFMVWRCPKWC